MMHDLRHINEYMCKTTFKQEDIRTIEQLVKQDDFLTSVDLSDAFYHIKVHKDYYRYLSFKFEGKYYSFKVLCFGLSLSPYLFHKITRPILGYLRSQNVRLSCYVDDFIICEKKNKITNNTDLVVNTLEDLGFHINRDKSSLTPGQNIDHIGYTIDTTGTYPVIKTHKTRIKRIKRQIKQILRNGRASARVFAKTAGLCVSTAWTVTPGKLFLRHTYALLASKQYWEEILIVNSHVIDELSWWLEAVDEFNYREIRVIPIDTTIEVDASKSGWGARLDNLLRETLMKTYHASHQIAEN